MIKTYVCMFKRCCISFGDGQSVLFDDRGQGEWGSQYTTNDKNEQEMLEKSPLFNNTFHLYSQESEDADEKDTPINLKMPTNPIEDEDKVVVEYDRAYPDIVRVQEAIGAIKDYCKEQGLPYETIRSREAMLAKAKELGLSFPKIK